MTFLTSKYYDAQFLLRLFSFILWYSHNASQYRHIFSFDFKTLGKSLYFIDFIDYLRGRIRLIEIFSLQEFSYYQEPASAELYIFSLSGASLRRITFSFFFAGHDYLPHSRPLPLFPEIFPCLAWYRYRDFRAFIWPCFPYFIMYFSTYFAIFNIFSDKFLLSILPLTFPHTP